MMMSWKRKLNVQKETEIDFRVSKDDLLHIEIVFECLIMINWGIRSYKKLIEALFLFIPVVQRCTMIWNSIIGRVEWRMMWRNAWIVNNWRLNIISREDCLNHYQYLSGNRWIPQWILFIDYQDRLRGMILFGLLLSWWNLHISCPLGQIILLID